MMKVGQIATWPKLHMIENRFRIENEILMGRRAVRMAIDRARSRTNPGDTRNVIVNGQAVPEPITGSRLRPRSESPIPLDSDTERAFEDNGTAWYFRRSRRTAGAPHESETSTTHENNYNNTTDPLRSPVLRRKWASDLLDRNGDSGAGNSSASPRTATPEPSADDPTRNASNSSTFFKNIKPGSLSIPFSGSHRLARSNGRGLSVNASEPVWSSESSSEDELDHLQSQSVLHFNTEFNEDAVSDGEGVDFN